MKKSKVWLLQTPRLPDKLAWGIREVAHLFTKNEYDCDIIDINHEIYREFYHTDAWRDIDDFGIDSKFRPAIKLTYDCIRGCFDRIQQGDTVIVSVFSTESRPWSNVVLVLLREKFKKTIQIGMGGSGCRNPGEKEQESEWCDRYLKSGIVDFVLLGESSHTVRKMCEQDLKVKGKLYEQGKKFPDLGFLPKTLIVDTVDRIHNPDYERADMAGHALPKKGGEMVTVHFTQGCVKQCSFCDVPLITPQWTMRSAEEVIDEIDHYYNLTGVTDFSFPDNTINGSDSEFMLFLTLLDKWQSNNESVSWHSQFSIKPVKQQTPDMFDLIAATGGQLAIGFDHCSDRVLTHMKKLYQWRDIEHFVEQSHRAGVGIKTAMWIVGYPTETVEDLLQYKRLFDLIKQYDVFQSHSVIGCSINRNSVLLDDVHIDWNNPKDWRSNTGLTRSMRIRRKNWVDGNLLRLKQYYYKLETTQKREK